jgi:outer membrane protein OmpA-like peptidoglycan-associated protein/subtilisin family serine protease
MDPALVELFEDGSADDIVSVILRLAPGPPPSGVTVVSRFGPIATCRLRRGDILRVRAEAQVLSMKAARFYGPALEGLDVEPIEDEDDLEPTATDQRRPAGGLPTGAGVVVAHIDWGLDIACPAFRKADGSTRILAIWDQAAAYDPAHPNAFGYGRIHGRAEIDAALRSSDPYRTLGYAPWIAAPGGGSHGTHTTSISCGNGLDGGPQGIAPEADIVFVDLSTRTPDGPTPLGDSVAFLEGMDFVARCAGERRLVINASLGRQAGQKDGRTLTEQGIDAFLLAAPGRAVVQSAGNYFEKEAHTTRQLAPGGVATLHFELPAGRGEAEVDLWYRGVDRLGVELSGPGGVRDVSVAPGERAKITAEGRVVGRIYHRIDDPNNHDNQVFLTLDADAPAGAWALRLTGVHVADGRVHAWIERVAPGAQRRMRFVADEVRRELTLGTIATSLWSIAVAAYDGHSPDRPLGRFCSSGPTRDHRRLKPFIAAPGVRVLASRSPPRSGSAPPLIRMNGTSMAAPHVAGAVALVLAAAPRRLSIHEIRAILLRTADPAAEGVSWQDRLRLGGGYLDIAAAVEAARTATPHGPPDEPDALALETVMTTEADAHQDAERWDDGLPVAGEGSEASDGRYRRGPAALPFQFQIPLGGGPAGIAVPIGGPASPFALAVPLGAPPAPPSAAPPPAAAAPREPAAPADPPLVVAAPDPQLLAGAPEAAQWSASEGQGPGEQLVRTQADLAQSGESLHSAANFSALSRALGDERLPGAPRLSASTLFALLGVDPLREVGPTFGGGRLVIVARPNQPAGDFEPRPGDLLIRAARGQRWGCVGVVSAAGMVLREHLPARGWRGEGDPSPPPGRYVQVLEPGPWANVDQRPFARRLTNAAGLVPPDTLLMRLEDHPLVVIGDTAEAAGGQTDVRWLQASLNQVMGTNLVVDGIAGRGTREAVRRFQQQHGLAADGVAGPRTLAALRALLGEQKAPLGAACAGLPVRQVLDHFVFGRPETTPAHQPQIANTAACIVQSWGSPTPITTLTLVGHTDPVGTDADNDVLGRHRAEAVRDQLVAAIRALGADATRLAITVESRGERDQVPGDAAASRRVEVIAPFAFPPLAPAQAVDIAIVKDDDDDHRVDGSSPVATFVDMGIWNHAYDAAGDVRNGQAEADNFVGSDRHRFYIRVHDPAATGATITATWRTLLANGNDDDAPASQDITLTVTAPGSHVYVSKALMLVTDNVDANQPTHSGLAAPTPDAGIRNRGQSNHRLRRGQIDGSVRARYAPATGAPVELTLAVFQRRPTDARRRLTVRVINSGGHATAPYIADQFRNANNRWNQVGLAIDPQATANRAIPAGVLDSTGQYPGGLDSPNEQAALTDLIGATADNTITVVFVRLRGSSAYTTLFRRAQSALGERYFIFMGIGVDLDTLAHEFHHAIYNRADAPVPDPFFTFNTTAPDGLAHPPPDVRVYRRIQDLHARDPDNDPNNDGILNWHKRRRTTRFGPAGAEVTAGPNDAANTRTGNTLVGAF